MTSKPVAFLMADLGVTKTHSRPHVSNDNPYSEAAFKTLKYRPGFPDSFGCIEDARGFCADFFHWYNEEHHHAGLALLTPADVHAGRAEARLAARAHVLAAAFVAHPERFVGGPPRPRELPGAVWINKPQEAAESLEAAQQSHETTVSFALTASAAASLVAAAQCLWHPRTCSTVALRTRTATAPGGRRPRGLVA